MILKKMKLYEYDSYIKNENIVIPELISNITELQKKNVWK